MRIKRGVNAAKKRRKILKSAKGFSGACSKLYRIARTSVMHAQRYAYVGRKKRKRDIRALWIIRINAAVRNYGLTYSKFIYGLKLINSNINRKMLADLAVNNIETINALCEQIKEVINK